MTRPAQTDDAGAFVELEASAHQEEHHQAIGVAS